MDLVNVTTDESEVLNDVVRDKVAVELLDELSVNSRENDAREAVTDAEGEADIDFESEKAKDSVIDVLIDNVSDGDRLSVTDGVSSFEVLGESNDIVRSRDEDGDLVFDTAWRVTLTSCTVNVCVMLHEWLIETSCDIDDDNDRVRDDDEVGVAVFVEDEVMLREVE